MARSILDGASISEEDSEDGVSEGGDEEEEVGPSRAKRPRSRLSAASTASASPAMNGSATAMVGEERRKSTMMVRDMFEGISGVARKKIFLRGWKGQFLGVVKFQRNLFVVFRTQNILERRGDFPLPLSPRLRPRAACTRWEVGGGRDRVNISIKFLICRREGRITIFKKRQAKTQKEKHFRNQH